MLLRLAAVFARGVFLDSVRCYVIYIYIDTYRYSTVVVVCSRSVICTPILLRGCFYRVLLL
jgi:hypothetical protein